MRRIAVVAGAATALVIIGTLEARESARQLAEVAGRVRLEPSGAGLTAIGLAASVSVYLALGGWSGADRDAFRVGAVTGALSGLAGGAIRAGLIADAVRDAIARYAAVPEWFVWVVLVVFVALCVVVSAAGGAACAFAGVRLVRGRRARSGGR